VTEPIAYLQHLLRESLLDLSHTCAKALAALKLKDHTHGISNATKTCCSVVNVLRFISAATCALDICADNLVYPS
jgi:hypothetical protein